MAAHDCVTTIPNRVLATILKLVFNTIKTHLLEEFRVTGVRKLWVIENSLEFVLSRPENIDHVFSSDINSMYTELDPHFVEVAVGQEVHFAFQISGFQCVLTRIYDTPAGNHKDTAFWSPCNVPLNRQRMAVYTIAQIRALTTFVLYNVYFTLGTALFKQLHGLPMGGNSSPFLANLALMHRERIFVTQNPTTPLQHQVFRYLDDFCVVNHPGFADPGVYSLIYPAYTGIVLEVNHVPLTPDILTHAHFLDLDIWVTKNPKVVYISLFDKRVHFEFDIHKFPDILSNMCPSQITTTFYTELVRLYRINTHSAQFLENVFTLTAYCLQERGYDTMTLTVYFFRFLRRIQGRNHLLPWALDPTYTILAVQFMQFLANLLLQPVLVPPFA